MDTDLPKTSGDLAAYEFYVWNTLHWQCARCDAFRDASGDIREGEEDAPEGPWAWRHAREAKELGWYVPPLTPEGSLIPIALCPECARVGGFVIAQSSNQTLEPTADRADI